MRRAKGDQGDGEEEVAKEGGEFEDAARGIGQRQRAMEEKGQDKLSAEQTVNLTGSNAGESIQAEMAFPSLEKSFDAPA